VKLVIQAIQKQFRPFHVPPVPQPISEAEIDAAEQKAEEDQQQEDMQAQALEVEIQQQDGEFGDVYIQQVVLDVHQNSDSQQNDNGFFTSHSAPGMEIEQADQSAAIRELLDENTYSHQHEITNRIERYEHEDGVADFERGIVGRRRRRQDNAMYAISVKRQRRLKMKKHKYKKLMRRTRTLRRKLGQI
jgi:hypothetical protein